MDANSDAHPPTAADHARTWNWQRRLVFGILVAIGVFYALAMPLVLERTSLIPLGAAFLVLAVVATLWWPRASTRSNVAE